MKKFPGKTQESLAYFLMILRLEREKSSSQDLTLKLKSKDLMKKTQLY